MIMTCFGFVLTVQSVFGIRIVLLRSTALSIYWKLHSEKIKGYLNRARVSLTAGTKTVYLQMGNFLFNPSPRKLLDLFRSMYAVPLTRSFEFVFAQPENFDPTSLEDFDFLRHPSLTWSGIVWRTIILCYLTGFGMWFWWSSWIPEHNVNRTEACDSSVYFFGPQTLDSRLSIFFKISTTTLSVFAYFSARFILPRFLVILDELLDAASINLEPGDAPLVLEHRRILEKLKPYLDKLKQNLDKLKQNPDKFSGGLIILTLLSRFVDYSLRDRPGHEDVNTHLRSIMGRDLAHELIADVNKKKPEGERRDQRLTCLSISFHVLILTVMGCFISFIEKTITVAEITGVYDIRSKGQLIPFIIGLVTSVKTIIGVITLWQLGTGETDANGVKSSADTAETGAIREQR